MIDHEIGDDRAIIYLNGDGPIALEDLTDSFSALSRIYKRHFEQSQGEANPKLFVSRLKTGSIEAEIVPLLMLVGSAVPYMDGAIIVRDFTKWVGGHVKTFAGIGTDSKQQDTKLLTGPISQEDAKDLREFLKPISGKKGAELGVKHAKFSKKDGEREMVAEYDFEESAINRASINLEKHILDSEEAEKAEDAQRLRPEVLMVWHQASREDGREKGRTGDKAFIESVCDRPLPVYFPKQNNDLKKKMAQDEPHPFSKAYIVDVNVDYVNGEPKLYRVINLHDTIDIDE
jgi:hypothetical protein